MGNSVSHCKSAEPGGSAGVRVKEALGGESTQLQGADASDDATSPADTAPAVPVTPKEPAPHASQERAGSLAERAKEAVLPAKEAVEHALDTAMSKDRSEAEEAGPPPRPPATEEGEGEEGGAASGGAAPGMKTITLRTAPNDPRFPVSNQSRYCYVRYNEYYKCVRDKGEENQECKFIKRAYRSICPDEWIERWEEMRENGNWYGKY